MKKIRAIGYMLMLLAMFHNTAWAYDTLQLGSSGDVVTRLQQEMQWKGYYVGETTGEFDRKTEIALIREQNFYGLVPNGIADDLTLQMVFREGKNDSYPEMFDFRWYLEDVMINGISDEAESIELFEDMKGVWWFLRISEDDVNRKWLAKAVISGTDEECQIYLDYYKYFTSEEDQTRGMEDHSEGEIYPGSIKENGLYCGGPGNLKIDAFYRLDGEEYAVGTCTFRDGTQSKVALRRGHERVG